MVSTVSGRKWRRMNLTEFANHFNLSEMEKQAYILNKVTTVTTTYTVVHVRQTYIKAYFVVFNHIKGILDFIEKYCTTLSFYSDFPSLCHCMCYVIHHSNGQSGSSQRAHQREVRKTIILSYTFEQVRGIGYIT